MSGGNLCAVRIRALPQLKIKTMTKKELIDFLEDYPDDIQLKLLPDSDTPAIMFDLTFEHVQATMYFDTPIILFSAD